jgi:hypothetical protein
MGHYLFSFAINTGKIRSAFGSKDQAILETIKANRTFHHYSDFQPDGTTTTPLKALEDMINGNSYDQQSDFSYGYALIGMCAALGKSVPYGQEIKLGYETDAMTSVLHEHFGLGELALDEWLLAYGEHPFKLPNIKGFPLIGMMERSMLEELKERLAEVVVTNEQIRQLEKEDFEKAIACQHIRGVISNIDYCLAHNLDMISFCH